MSSSTVVGYDNSSVLTIRALERACDQFETQWQSPARPSIEDYLNDAVGPPRARLLRELIALDLTYRRHTGERPRPEEYRDRFPADWAAIEAAFQTSECAPGGAAGDSQTARPPDPLIPTIPGYTVLEELGRGGMGVVFKATAERLNRFVALKMILSGDLASTEAGVRFLKEAESVARLQHPQVVQIFRIGDFQGRPFLEMEFVDGGSLADRLDGRPWKPVLAARLIESLAMAVHHAHLREIVHRDLKPANILLTSDGTPKVTDFGLAKRGLGVDLDLTRTDSIIGSPSYMAPEQAGGTASRIGPPTDVYSLGAILYELLTGRPPFRAATVLDTLEQVRSADPAPPSRIQPGLLDRHRDDRVLKCPGKRARPALRQRRRAIRRAAPISQRGADSRSPGGANRSRDQARPAPAAHGLADDSERGFHGWLDLCTRQGQCRDHP